MAGKLSEKVTSGSVLTLAGEEDCWQREQPVRDPETGVCLAPSTNTKEPSMAGTK